MIFMYKTTNVNPIYDAHDPEEITYEVPTTCPRCDVTLDPRQVASYYCKMKNGTQLTTCSIFFCQNCENFFILEGVTTGSSDEFLSHTLALYPTPSNKASFSPHIASLSKEFVEIYNQAYQAEQAGLSKICGAGYRKSLEFLVKDYAISESPDDESKIKKKLLGACINDHIDNKKIQTLAKASAWIGNDETHYERKHEDYDISHLKEFINAIVLHIGSELSLYSAEDLLNKDK